MSLSKLSTAYKKTDFTSAKQLLLLARLSANQFVGSQHKSKRNAAGQEFSQYRSYQAGDDIRLLDWKAYARSDRFYIRESEQKKGISIHFVLDTSASLNQMEYQIEDSETNQSKLDYAKFVLATLAYVADQQNDQLLFSFVQNGTLKHQNTKNLITLFNDLGNLTAEGKWDKVFNFYSKKNSKQLIIFISDFYEQNEEIRKSILKSQSRNNDVLCLHLLGEKERTLDYKKYGKNIIFEDLETGEQIQSTTKSKAAYINKMNTHLHELEYFFKSKNIDYQLLQTELDLQKQLFLFLEKRRALLNN